MKLNQTILVVLTFLVSVVISTFLLNSWLAPQPQSLLNLYQSDLILHASEGQRLQEATGEDLSGKTALLGKAPVQDALKQYETVRQAAQRDYERTIKQQKAEPDALDIQPPEQRNTVETSSQLAAKGALVDELDLRLGILKARVDKPQEAQQIWTHLIDTPQTPSSLKNRVPTAKVLQGLWSESPQILPNAERLLQTQTKGWFRFVALSKLYEVQQRPDAIINLGLVEQQVASDAMNKLLLVVALPSVAMLAGVGVLLIWGTRELIQYRKRMPQTQDSTLDNPPLEPHNLSSSSDGMLSLAESVTWPLETAWQGIVLWFAAFFALSAVVLPIFLGVFQIRSLILGSVRFQAYTSLINYLISMGIGYIIVQLTLKPYIPNALRWLKIRLNSKGILWGVGGYLAALPIVNLVALLNQKLLHDQGGGNQILDIILGSKDAPTIALLWFMVAVLAPLFEESLFRGFLLTSLARHLQVWQAIALSGFIFALAHQNLADLLPLTVLGMILGFVYLRSQNLLASMLLHSLWNSSSFIGLIILGSANSG